MSNSVSFDELISFNESDLDQTLSFHRDGWMQDGDWFVPANCWVARKWIYGNINTGIYLSAVVYGGYGRQGRHGRIRPQRWVAALELDQLKEQVGEGKCRSLKDAINAISHLDLKTSMNNLLHTFYNCDRAALVTRQSDGMAVVTIFGDYSSDYLALPHGKYFVDRQGRRSVVDRFYEGYCAKTLPIEKTK